MRRTIVATLLLNFVVGYAAASLRDTGQSSGVTVSWHWFQSCGSSTKNLGLVVLLDGKTVYRSQFPLCRNNEPPSDRKISFHIKGGHVFRGDYRTSPSQTIKVNIWQVKADPDTLLLAVKFASDRVLLNTTHVAKPDSTSVSQLDPGLEVKTFPLRHK
jgi:hypothetical protein